MAHDPEQLRKLFPACARYVYLNNAGVSLPSTRVRDAATTWLDDLLQHGLAHEETWESGAEGVRAATARLVGAAPDEIAFVRNTSHGLGLVAEGIDWRNGDEVAVASSIEYPSNVYPWLHLAGRGVKVAEIRPERGGVTVQGVADAIGPRTRLVAVSSAQYATGHRTDLAAIGALCRERGILFCVDGIQTVGAVGVDVKKAGIHFLSADSHKWMLGLPGIGFLYVDREALPGLRPVLVGWHSTTGAWDFDRARFELKADASKLEEGSPAYAMILGMGAAVDLLQEVGLDAIETHVGGLLARLERALLERGCDVGPAPGERAGILSFLPPPAVEAAALMQRFAAAKVSVSLRRGRVRVSPHLYNTEAEMDAVAAVVTDAVGGA